MSMIRRQLLLLLTIVVDCIDAFDEGDFHVVSVIFFSFLGSIVILGAIAAVFYYLCIKSWIEDFKNATHEQHENYHPGSGRLTGGGGYRDAYGREITTPTIHKEMIRPEQQQQQQSYPDESAYGRALHQAFVGQYPIPVFEQQQHQQKSPIRVTIAESIPTGSGVGDTRRQSPGSYGPPPPIYAQPMMIQPETSLISPQLPPPLQSITTYRTTTTTQRSQQIIGAAAYLGSSV